MKKYLVEKIWLYRKEQRNIVFCIKYVGKSFAEEIELKLKTYEPQVTKGRRFSEKDWYYLQAQTDMPFHYLKLIVWIFPLFLLLMSVVFSLKISWKTKTNKM